MGVEGCVWWIEKVWSGEGSDGVVGSVLRQRQRAACLAPPPSKSVVGWKEWEWSAVEVEGVEWRG